MMTAASFLPPLGERPSQYRTPSPPRRAVEPITPSTAEFRTSWPERGTARAASLDCDHRPSNKVQAPDVGSHQRSGHGRSNSTIDTLATIALATSPTFAPLASHPPSPNTRSTVPLFPAEATDSERPAKRLRSDRDPSPTRLRGTPIFAPNTSIFDSMKTDAELLLNLARPTNFHPGSHTKHVSIDESIHHYGVDSSRNNRVGIATGAYPGTDFAGFSSYSDNNIPPSRMRSRSDGSAFLSRPVIRGGRPTTSAGSLPPVVWEDENEDSAWEYSTGSFDHEVHRESRPPGTHESHASRRPVDQSLKTEEVDSDANQASCAACHMVRIPVTTEEQDEDTWIGCDGCKRWFHIVCAGFKNDREIRTVDKFICRQCRPLHGQTTFVRKSSRARTAIDYAGLNQGLVKAATDSLEHHYLEPIRQGRIRFNPENFPRMKPELVTSEYFERGNGWTEPVVIPACWNKREPVSQLDADFEELVKDASCQEMFDDLLDHLPEQVSSVEEAIDCGQDQLDMVIPQGLTVRAVAELYGPEERVEVIDVKSQQGEEKVWNLQKWADYYESNEPEKVVRNVISLEVSQSKLGRLIKRPRIVRDLDLQDAVWPNELKAIGDYPKVQFYCLMSVADCYTDFHIDFGGSSVYYHILKGKKTFFFIPPKDKHLKKYEEWCNSPAQDSIFLGNQTKECYRVDLSEGDTMLIPSGWIHAVWTPENSLVIGGNFLTRLNYGMQIKVLNIEKETKVPKKFRYPFFQKIQWYTAMTYLEDDPIPQNVLEAFTHDDNFRFHRHYPIYYEFGDRINRENPGSPYFNARFYSQAELEGLPELTKYLLRTALIAAAYPVEGVSMDVRNAVRRSIPKVVGDPVDMIRRFGIWVAWKRGNERAPQWTRPGVIESNPKVSFNEKKSSGRPSRRSERNIDNQRTYAERQAVSGPSEEVESTPVPALPVVSNSHDPPNNATPAPLGLTLDQTAQEVSVPKSRTIPRSSGLGPKRVACDACRRRRIRCRHKDEPNDWMLGGQMPMNGAGSGSGLSTPSSLAQDAVSALNSLAAIASQAGLHSNGVVGLDQFESARRFDPAIMGPSTASLNRLNDLSPDGANGGKKGRSKACDDCRKSKRRCIHDEYGRIDPIKAQERSKPRGTASAKRPRNNEEDGIPPTAKKTKHESPSPVMRPVVLLHTDPKSEPQPAIEVAFPGNKASGRTIASHDQSQPGNEGVHQKLYVSPPVYHTDSIDVKDSNALPASPKPTTSLVSPPTSLVDEVEVIPDGEALASVEVGAPTALHTPNSSSRHSSRQPRHVENLAPEGTARRGSKTTSRVSLSKLRRTTPGPLPASKKPSSRPSSSHAKKSAPMVEKRFDRKVASSLSPLQTSKHTKHHIAENDPDAESLRLIQQLQEEEFGLRKRSTRG